MSVLEMKVPSPGESISEVEIAQWLVSDGDYVEKDQAIAEVDSDKATLELPAEESGTITLKAEEGDAVAVGAVVCLIDTSAEKPAGFESSVDEAAPAEVVAAPAEKKTTSTSSATKSVSPDPVASTGSATRRAQLELEINGYTIEDYKRPIIGWSFFRFYFPDLFRINRTTIYRETPRFTGSFFMPSLAS